jgi:hypothetical protein
LAAWNRWTDPRKEIVRTGAAGDGSGGEASSTAVELQLGKANFD